MEEQELLLGGPPVLLRKSISGLARPMKKVSPR